jgi:hypothetical protein
MRNKFVQTIYLRFVGFKKNPEVILENSQVVPDEEHVPVSVVGFFWHEV